MSVEGNKAILRRIFEEAINKGNLDSIDEAFAKDFIWHGTDIEGIESFKQHMAVVRAAVPDLAITVEDQIAEGDKVVTRYTVCGTLEGDWYGVGPTGKQGTWTGINIMRLAGSKVVECWQNEDTFSSLVQFGVIESPWGDDD